LVLPNESSLRQIPCDQCRSAERHAIAGDRRLKHGGRIVDLQTSVAVEVGDSRTLEPNTPCRKSTMGRHRRVMDQGVMLQVGSALEWVLANQQGRTGNGEERVAQQKCRLQASPAPKIDRKSLLAMISDPVIRRDG